MRATPRREKIAAGVVRLLPKIFFAVYAAELFLLLTQSIWDGLPQDYFAFLGAVAVPAGCLLLSSLLRKKRNRPRPYETFPIIPLIQKDTAGQSFPSNHTASAFVLAMTAFRLSFPLGLFMLVLAAVTGASRIMAGLHWPEDVVCGMGIGVVLGVLELVIF